MQLDQDRAFGWDPPWWNERELNEELWKLTRTAARNWLKDQQQVVDESIDTLVQPRFFRVVRRTQDEQGRLAERAVLSGRHTTQDEARAALELEAARDPRWAFNPESGDWSITDTEGRTHLLLIDPF